MTFGAEMQMRDTKAKQEWNTLQDNLDDIENWSNGNRMKCYSTTCTAIHIGMNNKNFWYNWGAH